MYGTIKKGSTSSDVKELCTLLGVKEVNKFDDELDKAVRDFQKNNNLVVDGIVGYNTWKALLIYHRDKMNGKITDADYNNFACLLGVEPATLKAVVEVETGGRSGFLSNGRPQILFEGHIFWTMLKSAGKNPNNYTSGNEDILYPKWTKSKYKGGVKEYDRLEKAIKIDEECALKSASWGLFQIMGMNYARTGCSSVKEMVDKMHESEYMQLVLGIEFIKQANLVSYLKTKNWAGFALRYNGSGQVQLYSSRLQSAYKRHKKN